MSVSGVTVKMNVGEVATVGNYHVALTSNSDLIDNGACDSGSMSRALVVWPAP